MRESVETDDSPGPGCFYVGELDGVRYSVGLNLQRIEERSASQHESAHRQGAEKYGVTENVAGVGDSAFFSTIEHTFNQPDRSYALYVRSGETSYQIYAQGINNPAETRERMVEQAKTILRKLSIPNK